MLRWVVALVAFVAAGCAASNEGYTERIAAADAEVVIFFVEDAFVSDVEASLEALQDRVVDPDLMQIEWRDTEEVDLDPTLLVSAYGSELDESDSVGEAVLVDLVDDHGFSDDWLVETGDILARQRGVQHVTIGSPVRRLDPLCYWGGQTDLIVWLARETSADEIRSGHLADFTVEILSREAAYAQMLVFFEFQPELSSVISFEAVPTALLVDVGDESGRGDLLSIRDDLESLADISSVIVRPPATVRTVCP
jgi:hypothetical protein